MSDDLPHSFDLSFNIKDRSDLEAEILLLSSRLSGIIRMMAQHDIPMPQLEREDIATLAATTPLQDRVAKWVVDCFGKTAADDIAIRCDRFMEEATELVQSLGHSVGSTHAVVDYVFDRPAGEVHQEVGGTMLTLAALCTAASVDLAGAAETELARAIRKTGAIRIKNAAKPNFGGQANKIGMDGPVV